MSGFMANVNVDIHTHFKVILQNSSLCTDSTPGTLQTGLALETLTPAVLAVLNETKVGKEKLQDFTGPYTEAISLYLDAAAVKFFETQLKPKQEFKDITWECTNFLQGI
eukprot:TRINITY_DN67695_c0_g1_i9.p1 TRINITY_DN67695_c0_g1~~TRINITY_DN67695_c0_g1_i9.p1  ORF type:complete len:109 (+),score=6.86 TRINITY_DN67695_c0_g1_i9:913-1239(+)